MSHDPKTCPKCLSKDEVPPDHPAMCHGILDERGFWKGAIVIQELESVRLLRKIREISYGRWHFTDEERKQALDDIAATVGPLLFSAWSEEAVADLIKMGEEFDAIDKKYKTEEDEEDEDD